MCGTNNAKSLLEVRDGEGSTAGDIDVDSMLALIGAGILGLFATLIWVLL